MKIHPIKTQPPQEGIYYVRHYTNSNEFHYGEDIFGYLIDEDEVYYIFGIKYLDYNFTKFLVDKMNWEKYIRTGQIKKV